MRNLVLMIQGGGEGAHKEDAELAASLQKALGQDYEVCYPRMPNESDPNMPSWEAKIAEEFTALDGRVFLLGHSIGGMALLKYLSEAKVEKPIAGLFLLATPSWDGKDWNFDELRLSPDLAVKLSAIPQIFLYHNRDDEIVPFSHLALHAAKLPHAIVREGKSGGHQFGTDLSQVANDIKRLSQVAARS